MDQVLEAADWVFYLEAETPDGDALKIAIPRIGEYMDGSIVDHVVLQLGEIVTEKLKEAGYIRG